MSGHCRTFNPMRSLLRTCAQTRKTFINQNWESDWAIRGSFDPATKPRPTGHGSDDPLAGRPAARGGPRPRGAGAGGARFFHACEVNLVASYSVWDTKDSPAQFAGAPF